MSARGITDELGQKAIENLHPLYHFNATILHLLDLDFERLTNVDGKLISTILA